MKASRRVVVAGLVAVACSGDGPGPGTTPAQLVLTASPASATAGVPLSPAVKVSVLDSKGNVATAFDGGVHIALAANPGGGTLSGTTTVSASAGVATFSNLMLDKSGAGYTLVVSSNGLAGDTSNALTVVPGAVSAAQSSVSAAPAAIAASTGSSAATVTVTARDAFGNLVPGVTVSLAATGSGNTITPPPGPTDAAGVATGTLSSTVAGTKTVSATAGGVPVSQTASVVVAAGSAIRLRFVTQPTNAAAGSVISPPLQLEARDVFGNLATSYTGNVTIAIAASPAPGTLSGTKTVPMANGAASFGDLSIDKVGAGYTLQVTASPVLTPDTSTSFDITAGPPAQLAFLVQPTNTTGGTAIAPAVQVEIRDAAGNRVTTATNSVTLALGTNPKGGALSGTTTVTAASGVATFGSLAIDSAATGYTLAASAAGVPGGATSNAFNVAVGAAAQLGFRVQPASTTGGTVITPAVQVEIRDAGGNRVTTATNTVTVAIGSNPGNGSLGGTKSTPAVSGVASFSTLTIDSAGTGYTLNANAAGLATGTSNAFNISVGPAAKLAFGQQPTSAIIGATISPAVTVRILDAGGNLTASTANVTVAITPGTGTTGAHLSGGSNVTAAAVGGSATFGNLSIDSVGAGYTLTATSGTLTATTSSAFNISAGPAAKLAFGQQPTSTTAGSTIAPAVTLRILDSAGNLTGSTANVTIAITAGTGTAGAHLSGGASVTVAAVAGIATFSGLSIDSAGTGYTLTATSSSLTAATSSAFNISVGAAAKLAFSQQPTSTTGGATIAPAVTVRILDAGGNQTASTANVTLAITSGTGTPGAHLSGGSSVTAAAVAGVATFGTLNVDSLGTGYTLTATSGSVTADTSSGFNISLGPAAKLAFGQQPTATSGGAPISPAVTVRILDAGGNLTASTANVTVAIVAGTGTTGAHLGGTATVAAAGGIATFSGLSIDSVGTGYRLSATSGVLTAATSNTFNVTAGPAARLVFGQQPTSATGGATISPAVTVRILDAGGNLTTSTANVTVAITSGTGTTGAHLSGGASVTVAAVGGIATFGTLSIDSAGTGYTLAATSGLLTATSGAFNITVGPAAKLAFGQQPTSTTGGATIAPAVTVRILDAGGNLTASTANVTLAITSGTGTTGAHLSGGASVTAAAVSGIATFGTLSIDSAGTGYTLRATGTSLTAATSNPLTISVGTAAKLGFLVQPSTTASGASITPAVQVEVRDLGGNRVTSATTNITLAIGTNPSGGILSGTNPQAAVNGVATFSNLSIDKSGTGYTLTAAGGTLTGATSSPFNITGGTADHLGFFVQPSNDTAGSPISPAVQVEVLDVAGNRVTTDTRNITVAIFDNPNGGTLSGTKTVAASAGVASFSGLSIDKAGTGYTLLATSSPALTSALSVDFDIAPAAPNRLHFFVEPSTTPAGASIAPDIQTEVLDAFGNRVGTATNTVTVALLANPGGGTLSGTKTRSASAGVATFPGLSINKAANGYTIRATSSGLASDTSVAFNITPGPATQLVFTSQPTSTAAGAIIPAVAVTAQDAQGNTATGFTGAVTMAIGTNPGGGTLSGTLSVPAVGGVATFSDLSMDKVGVGYTLAASATGPSGATSGTFNITVGPATKLVFGQQPTATTGGIAISPAVTVRILDASGNLTNSTASVTVAITTGTGTDGAHLGGTITRAAVAGVATFNDVSIDSAGTAYTLIATSSGLTADTSSAFNVSVGTGAKLDFLVQPSTTPPGGTITPAVQVEIRDAGGNLVTGDNTTSVTVAIGTNPSGGTLGGTKSRTAAAGVATFSNLSINNAGSGYTLTATAGTLTGATSNSFDIVVGTATQLAFGVQPSSATGGAVITPAVTVEIRDAANNVVTNATNSVTLTFGANPKSGHLLGTKTVAAVGGVATFNGLSIDSAATGYTLNATSGVLTGATSNTFNITVGPATTMGFRVQPSNATGGTAISPAVQIEVRDAGGNRVTTASNSITIAIGTNPNSGTLSGTTTLAASSGVASFSSLSIDSAAAGYRLAATASGLTGATSNTFNITVGAAAQLGFFVQPSDAAAGTSITPAVKVEIRDAGGNRVTTASNNVTVAIGNNPGSGTLGGTKSAGATSGVATFSNLSINKAGVGYTLVASATSLTSATSLGFDITADGVSASLSTLVAATDTIGQCSFSCTAGIHASSVTVTVMDQFGNLVSGAPVTLSANGTGNGFSPSATGNTDVNGVFSAAFNSSVFGAKTVSASAGGVGITQTAAVAVMPVLVGAGDIADCNSIADDATANQLDSIPGTVFAAGDNAYPNGTATDFANCYDPTWGRHKTRTKPVVGNHEYDSSGTAAAYFSYFTPAVADPLGNGFGYYSFDLGTWHVVVLNSDSGVTNPVSGPAQLSWLQSDLAGRSNQCVLAIWHRPLFTSGSSGGAGIRVRRLWQALEDAGAEIVINGHDHLYERFAPQDSLGNATPAGIREFIAGTGGGETHSNYVNSPLNVEASDGPTKTTFSRGVLRLTLYDKSYRWEFLPAQGQGTYTDSGTQACH